MISLGSFFDLVDRDREFDNPLQLLIYSNFQFVLYMTFQELQWHVVDDVDFNDAEADILEIVYESQILVLDGIE